MGGNKSKRCERRERGRWMERGAGMGETKAVRVGRERKAGGTAA